MADPITPEDSVLTAAIKDMSFEPWHADPEKVEAHNGSAAQAYMAQRAHWMHALQLNEPWALDIFVENYPARSDMEDGVVAARPTLTPAEAVAAPLLTQAGLPESVAEYVRRRREEGVDVHVQYVPAPELTKREQTLREANRIIHGDREKDYGRPIDSFTRLAEALNLVLRPKLREGVELDAVDAAVLMIAMKLSRLAGGDRKDDTWVDLAGYSALGAEVRDQL
ncbi:hypothetical protein SEA_CELAENA_25 [Microbacterium phage Celaena]|uniref:hypothetical protein n=1 Tax=Microbacterium phage Celaena TaxID=2591214 RepID=UPI001165B5B5|nr:hypothetical protein QDW17_gp25 [Microbacterium phage Celaena]QDH92404.1 hypothetical protein SEA_CELAENA_25 [Microbacterium phage Celaena]